MGEGSWDLRNVLVGCIFVDRLVNTCKVLLYLCSWIIQEIAHFFILFIRMKLRDLFWLDGS